MPSKVILKVVRGKLTGQQYEFAERVSCIIGKTEDCSVRLPHDHEHRLISRHHCLLDINPPDVRVRDFGSLNGTLVNGQKIGQREKSMTPVQASGIHFPERDLKEGDEIQLGDTVFRVSIYVPARCEECSSEIPDEKKAQAERLPGVFQCEACRNKAELAHCMEPPKKKAKVCAQCGRDVGAEMGMLRHGEYICTLCQADPLGLVKRMLGLANQGDPELGAIQGYTIERELGRGGMGIVWAARHDRTGERVALKMMLPKVAVVERAKASFLREVELTKALRHQNIVAFRESGCSGGKFFLTLEFCSGGSVDKLMARRGGKLLVQEAMAIIFEVLDGLAYAHQARISRVKLKGGSYAEADGMVHRDLSPHNILLSEQGGRQIAKISDFGLSKAFDKAGLSGQSCTGSAAGKPLFMPRQQVVNFKYAKPEVDVWAAAACLYNMLTGTYPRDFIRGRDPWQIILQCAPVPILQRLPTIPKALAKVIDHALIDQPKIGFDSAAAFKQALQEAL